MITKAYKIVCTFFVGCGIAATTASCEDFFEQESDHVVYTNKDHLTDASDTIYSVTGILKKLQAVADRTILLGDVRSDLVNVTSTASADLRELSTFSADAENVYNQPRDYYAVINNCNYFIANVDTALKNNRGQNIFLAEYAAVKAIRAWTYLQLVLNYGQVPFVTEPILTKEQSERDYPMYGIRDVCDYFVKDLADIPATYNRTYPGYRTINGYDSRLFWYPLNIVRGDLNLWGGHYREAALCYYNYINERNGDNSAYPTGTSFVMWSPGTTSWTRPHTNNWSISYSTSYGTENELITLIPDDSSDSIRSEGFYSELRDLYTSNSENEYKVSLTPSARMTEISEAQTFCCLNSNGTGVYYAPNDLNQHRTGDLRLSQTWSEGSRVSPTTNERVETQYIYKHAFVGTGVHIYRRQMVYLRLAEALNQAGYPRMAYMVLTTGLSNQVIQDEVLPYYPTLSDSTFIGQFQFADTRYAVVDAEDLVAGRIATNHNMLGIHTRGSGWTPMNEYYLLPNDSIEPDDALRAQLVAEQQVYVDSLLLDEGALELCFEGTRYYDLMRFALRQPNPGQFLADKVYARRGTDNKGLVQSEVQVNLTDQRNWFLHWNGKIGY